MTIFYVASAGSNTSPYDTWAKAATNPQSAISLLAADGDEVVYEDEIWVAGTLSDAAISAPSGASFTIRSNSNNPATCTLDRQHATNNLVFLNQAGNDWNFTFKGFGLKNTTTYTGVGGACIRASANFTGDISFDDCVIDPFTFALSGACVGPLVRIDGTGCTLHLNNTTISNISGSNTYAGAFDTYIYVAAGGVTINDLTISDITKTQTVNDQANLGFIRARRVVDITDIFIDNYTTSCPNSSTGNHYAILFFDNAGYGLAVNGMYVLDSDSSGATVTKTGGAHSGTVFNTSNIFTIKNVIAELTTTTEPTVVSNAGIIRATGNTAQGTIDNIIVRNCDGTYGTGVYMSQGAGVVINNIIAHDNTAVGRAGVEAGAGGGCYFGGWGDCTINTGLFYNNTAGEGGAIYAHVHGGATVAPTRNLNNITTFNNTATKSDSGVGGDGIVVKGSVAAYQHTVNVVNNTSWNAGTDEIYASGSYVTLNIDHSNIRGGAAAVTGEDSYTNNINADPQFHDTSSADFHIGSLSPCLYQGINIGLTSTLDGEAGVLREVVHSPLRPATKSGNNSPNMGAY